MADIINLRQARKARSRAAAETRAATNRALHGRTREEKLAAKADKARVENTLNGARRVDSIEPKPRLG